jgi:nitroreductase
MDIADLVKRSRTYRRFDASHAVTAQTLRDIVDCARFVPSGGNMQTLRYLCTNTPEWNEKVFSALAWAGYLPEWGGPVPGERPTAYVVIANDTSLRKVTPEVDLGIAAQTMVLAAVAQGLGACMFGSVRRERLRELLGLAPGLDILMVIALGKPVEHVVVEEVAPAGSIKYYRDESGTHHVPKRRLEDVLLDIR